MQFVLVCKSYNYIQGHAFVCHRQDNIDRATTLCSLHYPARAVGINRCGPPTSHHARRAVSSDHLAVNDMKGAAAIRLHSQISNTASINGLR